MKKYTLKETLSEVEKVIATESDYLAGMDPSGLFEPVKYTLDLGGKRLRPLLALLFYRAFSGKENSEEIAPVMKAVELFHNFSLIHDDLMDDAPIRRGKPTVYTKWSPNQAILSGDAMLIEAYTALAEANPEYVPELLTVFNDMARAVCIGQQQDMEFEQISPSEIDLDDYLDMVTNKTTTLLTGSSLMGALVGGLDNEEDVSNLTEAVGNFGNAFQIMDDYLDVFSDVKVFGKRKGGDILEGKRTYLLLSAYDQEPEEVERILGLHNDEDKITQMTALYTQLGIEQEALMMIDKLTEVACEKLALLSVDTSLIAELFTSLLGRKA